MTGVLTRERTDRAPRPPAPSPEVATPLVTPRIVLATARRVLAQLRGDRRTMAMLLAVPGVLLALTNQMFDSQPEFNRVAMALLGIFPFTLMFLVTSVAMLRERTGGTLERLLTTPMSKLDLLLGYGLAFAVVAAAQAIVTCVVAYWLLGLYTPGNPLLVVGIAIAGAVLGMAIGLLTSAFATSEFQAVQFMPVVVLPQVLLGGLFVPREQMSDWLERVSDALPMSYSIDAMSEVGSRSLVTGDLVLDVIVVVVAALLALVLAATTLRRRTGGPGQSARARVAVLLTVLVTAATVVVVVGVDAARYVSTDNAKVDGDQVPLVATETGTLLDWRASDGAIVRKNQEIGRIKISGGGAQPRKVLRAPADGVVSRSNVVEGAFVPVGTELAVTYDLSEVFVTANIDETDIADVRLGQPVDITVDADPGGTVGGVVREIQGSTAAEFADPPPNNVTTVFEKVDQVVPVKIAITDPRGLTLVPGMNVEVKIHKD